MSEENKALSYLERLKKQVQEQKKYGCEYHAQEARIEAATCPNCGAGRAKMDGLTKCAYCGHEFLKVELTDGINIKKDDNSK